MNILKLAAFSHNGKGGNPAGVVFFDTMPGDDEMLRTAAEVGYSETAFLVKQAAGWRVRYFAPAREVPFCGHATIALGAALGERFGNGDYKLYLNDSEISVRAEKSKNLGVVLMQRFNLPKPGLKMRRKNMWIRFLPRST